MYNENEYEQFKTMLQNNCGTELYHKLSGSCAGIAGLGGLGSNVAVSLARSGVGRLVICDFDVVEMSNINRQQYRLCDIGRPKTDALESILKSISPVVRIEKHQIRAGADNIRDIFAGCDVICECFDRPSAKQEIVETVLTKLEVPIIAASGLAGYGRSNDIITRQINERFFLVGDMESGIDKVSGLYAARVAIAANHQANKVLELLLK
ncbi:MAG: sulfur carrier protein ThiS adenylyltransferase ThiF [Phycisphaerae bacterium]|jgi:sulfur carrier protein ThiS adenylyltransferase